MPTQTTESANLQKIYNRLTLLSTYNFTLRFDSLLQYVDGVAFKSVSYYHIFYKKHNISSRAYAENILYSVCSKFAVILNQRNELTKENLEYHLLRYAVKCIPAPALQNIKFVQNAPLGPMM